MRCRSERHIPAAATEAAQRRGLDYAHARVGDQLIQQRLLAPGLPRPHPQQQRERHALKPVQQEPEPAQRRGVRPLRVVDQQQSRAGASQIGGKPVEAVQHRERIAAPPAVWYRCAREHALGQPAGASQELASPLLAGREEDRLEELPHDAEGEVALELGRAGAQHLQILRGLSRRGEQTRLPDPRRPFDDRRGALTPSRRGAQARELLELALPLHERRLYHLPLERTFPGMGRKTPTPPSRVAPRRSAVVGASIRSRLRSAATRATG
jgi:hypothetical protein